MGQAARQLLQPDRHTSAEYLDAGTPAASSKPSGEPSPVFHTTVRRITAGKLLQEEYAATCHRGSCAHCHSCCWPTRDAACQTLHSAGTQTLAPAASTQGGISSWDTARPKTPLHTGGLGPLVSHHRLDTRGGALDTHGGALDTSGGLQRWEPGDPSRPPTPDEDRWGRITPRYRHLWLCIVGRVHVRLQCPDHDCWDAQAW